MYLNNVFGPIWSSTPHTRTIIIQYYFPIYETATHMTSAALKERTQTCLPSQLTLLKPSNSFDVRQCIEGGTTSQTDKICLGADAPLTSSQAWRPARGIDYVTESSHNRFGACFTRIQSIILLVNIAIVLTLPFHLATSGKLCIIQIKVNICKKERFHVTLSPEPHCASVGQTTVSILWGKHSVKTSLQSLHDQ